MRMKGGPSQSGIQVLRAKAKKIRVNILHLKSYPLYKMHVKPLGNLVIAAFCSGEIGIGFAGGAFLVMSS